MTSHYLKDQTGNFTLVGVLVSAALSGFFIYLAGIAYRSIANADALLTARGLADDQNQAVISLVQTWMLQRSSPSSSSGFPANANYVLTCANDGTFANLTVYQSAVQRSTGASASEWITFNTQCVPISPPFDQVPASMCVSTSCPVTCAAGTAPAIFITSLLVDPGTFQIPSSPSVVHFPAQGFTPSLSIPNGAALCISPIGSTTANVITVEVDSIYPSVQGNGFTSQFERLSNQVSLIPYSTGSTQYISLF